MTLIQRKYFQCLLYLSVCRKKAVTIYRIPVTRLHSNPDTQRTQSDEVGVYLIGDLTGAV